MGKLGRVNLVRSTPRKRVISKRSRYRAYVFFWALPLDSLPRIRLYNKHNAIVRSLVEEEDVTWKYEGPP